MSQLNDLLFSDLFVADTATESWYKQTPDSLETHSFPEEHTSELAELRLLLEQNPNSDFKITWPLQDGLRFRVKKQQIADDKIIYIVRRYRVAPGPLSSLGMPKAVSDKLMADDLVNGLVIFLGKTGSGKTTTASSFTTERLKKFGGVCWTVENPIELPIQGRHEKGVLYQTEISHDDQIDEAIRGLYRATPNSIFIGEIRTAKAAREAIAVAASGVLVACTFHANDVTTGLARFTRMVGNEDTSASLADVLRVAICLNLVAKEEDRKHSIAFASENPQGTGTPPRILMVEPLWVTDDATRAILRNGEFHQLASEITKQRNQFLSGMNRPLPGSRG